MFLLPSQLALHFWPDYARIFGIKVDYLAVRIYLTDILVLAIFTLTILAYILENKTGRKATGGMSKKYYFLASLGTLILLNTLFAANPFLAVFQWLKLGEMFFIGWFIFSDEKIFFKKNIVTPLAISTLLVSLIGILQFIFQKTLGGPLYYLGERSFNATTPGIALVNLFGREYLRAYAIFSHPNALAGFILTVLCLIKLPLRRPSELVYWISVLTAFLLTFSRTAFIVLFILVVLLIINKFSRRLFTGTAKAILWSALILSLVQPFLAPVVQGRLESADKSIRERFLLLNISRKVVGTNLFTGVGLNNFVPQIPDNIDGKKFFWTLQPVHNIFVLVFAEGGLLGLGCFLGVIYLGIKNCLKKKRIFLLLALTAIIVTGVADHYWLTQQQNLFLFSVVLGLTFRKKLD